MGFILLGPNFLCISLCCGVGDSNGCVSKTSFSYLIIIYISPESFFSNKRLADILNNDCEMNLCFLVCLFVWFFVCVYSSLVSGDLYIRYKEGMCEIPSTFVCHLGMHACAPEG